MNFPKIGGSDNTHGRAILIVACFSAALYLIASRLGADSGLGPVLVLLGSLIWPPLLAAELSSSIMGLRRADEHAIKRATKQGFILGVFVSAALCLGLILSSL